MDLIKEDQIGAAAADRMFEHLKKVPLVISLRNADLTVGTTRIAGSADISISVGEVLGQ